MAVDLYYQLFKITFFFNKVDLIGIYDQKRCVGIIKKEIIEGFIYRIEIIGVHKSFIIPTSFGNSLYQDFCAGLQKYD